MFPAAKLIIAIGTKNGDILFDLPVTNLVHSVSIVANPPIPEPTITPNLFLSTFSKSILELFIASSAAINAI
ncbi:Uncharacterised protein [Clostridioides difficile]|nr:Uncharacterised protein [Clostridioides difficile]